MDDSDTYDTLVRIAGSFVSYAHVFKAVADMYHWRHIAVISDDETESFCWYGAKPIDRVLGSDSNYTIRRLRFSSDPTERELDDILQQIRSHARGSFTLVAYKC